MGGLCRVPHAGISAICAASGKMAFAGKVANSIPIATFYALEFCSNHQ